MAAASLSILIPVYNFDIRPLVQGLSRQAEALPLPVEVLCFDDASDEQYRRLNAAVGDLPGVEYRLLPENLGRSRIRNLLAREARYAYLLFLDCDSGLPDGRYLQRYAGRLQPDTLLYGGRIYQPERPADSRLALHWHYGRRREARPASERQQQPYHSFMTNNFVIPATAFAPIQFDSRLLQYGHEDTLFGMELKKRNIPIRHLENPLLHLGLEDSRVFLRKTRQAIENLAFLHQQGSGIEARLLQVALRLRNTWAGTALRETGPFLRPALQQQLQTAYPSLRLFDLYKLSCILEELYLRERP